MIKASTDVKIKKDLIDKISNDTVLINEMECTDNVVDMIEHNEIEDKKGK